MRRRHFLMSPAAAVQCLSAPAQKARPNVLFLMTDELHLRSLSINGNPYIRTPHMDRIAREGALFTNATCVTPFCSPSRASMVTGLYPHRHGIVQNVGRRGRQAPLAPQTFPSTEMTLHGQGYATGFRGKWHLGDLGDFPCYESFAYGGKTDSDYAAFLERRLPAARFRNDRDPGRYHGRPVVKIPAIRNAWQPFQKAVPGLGYIATIGRTVIPPELLPETRITEQVLELMERNRDRSFMITASWSPPHDLWVAPEPYYSMVDRRAIRLTGSPELEPWDRRGPSKVLGDLAGEEGIREYIAIYHGMVKYIDDQVGRVLRKLDGLGLAGNTMVIFTTDHGDMAGAHGCIGKSVFGFFDDLVRIPLCVRFPGRIQPGTVVRNPVSQIDYMPTILDYMGLGVPAKIHGRSLRPLMEGRRTTWRDYAFSQRGANSRMLRAGRYKYVFSIRPEVVALYDLEADPHEDRNVARDAGRAATLRLMHTRLMDIMAQDGDPLLERYPKEPLASRSPG